MTRLDRSVVGFLYLGAFVLAIATSAYSAFLHAPAVMAARPGLADLGFWTALFSGRFSAWLFYHDPLLGTALSVAVWMGLATVVWWTA